MKKILEIDDIEKPASEFAITRGWWQCKFTSPTFNGVPDRLYIRNGVVIFIEYKAPDKPPTAQQLKRHREMRKHGATVYVVDNLDGAKEILL